MLSAMHRVRALVGLPVGVVFLAIAASGWNAPLSSLGYAFHGVIGLVGGVLVAKSLLTLFRGF
jgi:hypothetical protein